MFNVTRIVDAIVAEHASAWQVALIEERAANPKADKEKALDNIIEGIVARVEAGEIDELSARPYISNARTLMMCKLDTLINAASIGHGINALCRRIREAEGKRSNAGRKAGSGKGKTAAANATPAEKTPTIPADDRTWKQVLEGMIAKVPGRKDWASEDIVAFQDCASKMIALLKRNSK